MPSLPITISAEAHKSFTSLSGDYNPLHTDPVLARRFIFGKAVVHGIHLILRAIDSFAKFHGRTLALEKLKCTFTSAVGVKEPIEVVWVDESSIQTLLEVHARGEKAIELGIGWVDSGSEIADVASILPVVEKPQTLQPAEVQGAVGTAELCAEKNVLRSLFPNLLEYLPISQIAVLLATTRIVGMKCPGYHSIYSGLNINFDQTGAADNHLLYKVIDLDSRFNLVKISLDCGNATGQINAFIRPAPAEQPSSTRLKGLVDQDDFHGRRYLIIGGSRGIGEISAKLAALGGADIKLTYVHGEDDAHRVIEDIFSEGGNAQAIQYDVHDAAETLLDRLAGWKPTHLIYLATPFIFQGKRGSFSYQLFSEFAAYYVEEFTKIFTALNNDSALLEVLYPSTTAIDEQPPGMSEYVAAKSAGEVLCAYLAKSHPKIVFKVPRLPRVATDQTASLMQTRHNALDKLIVTYLKG